MRLAGHHTPGHASQCRAAAPAASLHPPAAPRGGAPRRRRPPGAAGRGGGGGGAAARGAAGGGAWTHQLAVKDAPKKVEQLVVWVVLLPHGACISQQGSLENECLHSFGFSRVNEADGALQAKQGAQQVLGV